MRFWIVAAAFMMATPAAARDSYEWYQRQREINALRDAARAQERQAESLRRIERIEHERNRREERAARESEIMSRSARRFDRR